MRNLWLMLIGAMFIFTGCMGSEISRGVKNNIFYSTYPEVAVQLPSELEYIDKTSNNINRFNDAMQFNTNIVIDEYFFSDQGKFKQVFIIIKRLERNHTVWRANLLQGKTFLASGHESINGFDYQYLVKKDAVTSLYKYMGRVAGGDRKYFVAIVYQETIPGLISLEQWENMNALTPEQKIFYDGFMARSRETIKSVNLKELDLPK